MKLLMIIGPHERHADLRAWLAREGVHAWTELPQALGEGTTGLHLDTRVFPGASALFFTAVPDERAAELTERLRAFAAGLRPGEGLRAFVLPADQIV